MRTQADLNLEHCLHGDNFVARRTPKAHTARVVVQPPVLVLHDWHVQFYQYLEYQKLLKPVVEQTVAVAVDTTKRAYNLSFMDI